VSSWSQASPGSRAPGDSVVVVAGATVVDVEAERVVEVVEVVVTETVDAEDDVVCCVSPQLQAPTVRISARVSGTALAKVMKEWVIAGL